MPAFDPSRTSVLVALNADGAIRLAKLAAAKAPRFADPVETRGEALLVKGDAVGAAERFGTVDRLAPH